MEKRAFILVGTIAIAFLGYLAFTIIDSNTPIVIAAKTYSTTMYIAGHGGHFAKADVMIDPSDAENPIKINSLDKIDIGTTVTHKTHDARIDVNDRNVMFWSTSALDDKGKQHVGKSDLKTGKVIKDVALDPDPRAPGKTGPIYCASGQSKAYFMPVFMGTEGYVDVLDKRTLEKKHRVFVSDLGYKAGTYESVHGTNSHDMTTFLISITIRGEDGKMNGRVDSILVDLPSLEKGKFKELARNTISGEPGKTIAFRQYFSNDDRYIFQAAADRIWLLDAATLKLLDEKMVPGQNHDAMPSPDGKYAILTLRSNTAALGADGKAMPDKTITDGALLLYDADAKTLVGKPTSTCLACHKSMGLGDKNAVLCGLDANWKK